MLSHSSPDLREARKLETFLSGVRDCYFNRLSEGDFCTLDDAVARAQYFEVTESKREDSDLRSELDHLKSVVTAMSQNNSGRLSHNPRRPVSRLNQPVCYNCRRPA